MSVGNQIKVLENRILELEQENKILHESVSYLTRKLYGRSSEKTSTLSLDQMSLFDEAETEANPAAPEPDLKEVKGYHQKKFKGQRAEFLKGFNGFLHTDAYSGYNKVPEITRCLCWTHLRRKFVDALPKDIHSPEATLPSKGIRFCNKLFKIEKTLEDLLCEQR